VSAPLRRIARRERRVAAVAALLLGIVLGAAALAGCGGGGGGRDRVTIALDWVPNTNHTGIYVAQAKGWFRDEGIDLRILPYSGADTDVLVNSGRADLGISFVPSLLVSRAAGLHIRSVAEIMKRNEEAIAVLADSRFRRPRDLARGTTYGGFGLPFETPLWSALIRADGGSPDFRNVTLDTTAYDALYHHRVDWTSLFLGWEGVEARQRGIRLRLFRPADYLGAAGRYPSVILVSSEQDIRTRGPVLRRALAALSRGYTFAAQHPAAAAAILTRQNPSLAKSPRLVEASALFLAPAYTAGGRWGTQTLDQFSGLGNLLWRAGVLKGSGGTATARPDFSQAFTNSLLPGGSAAKG
jgi:ABC-type nitrate/sulfonate/bicarbonate transport system substrate-binding protein